ncbi:hypothetical protein Psfp_03301 [Pelotomaculum sp. FP]|uniref:DUF3795 domain-containing protein n=1 Tax=Pelotomaculum sp. FP TaxID=261474 RepID=UPI0010649C5B|nr:DUF3795 domain-containing protein [Pelotomaculum sp. FP]TEB13951.1 hypothetical protein Psfp_03301 [Pelotomaculum sp. FP]
MEYKEAVRRLAPCGLDCSRCADYAGGEIRKLSVRLVELLNGYLRVARVKEAIKPVFTGYPQFEEVLKSLTQAACSGCRGDNVLCPIECVAGVCSKEKGVDFCFQCEESPCSKKIDTQIQERWLRFNLRMKEIGVEDFYQEQSRLPRY